MGNEIGTVDRCDPEFEKFMESFVNINGKNIPLEK